MRAQLLSVRAVAPVAQKSVTVIFGTESRNTVVTGTDNDYFITQRLEAEAGRTFSDGEVRAGARRLRDRRDGARQAVRRRADPIGQNMRVNKSPAR